MCCQRPEGACHQWLNHQIGFVPHPFPAVKLNRPQRALLNRLQRRIKTTDHLVNLSFILHAVARWVELGALRVKKKYLAGITKDTFSPSVNKNGCQGGNLCSCIAATLQQNPKTILWVQQTSQRFQCFPPEVIYSWQISKYAKIYRGRMFRALGEYVFALNVMNVTGLICCHWFESSRKNEQPSAGNQAVKAKQDITLRVFSWRLFTDHESKIKSLKTKETEPWQSGMKGLFLF